MELTKDTGAMRVIVAGSRTTHDYEAVADAMAAAGWPVDEVVSGGARGVDALAEQWAQAHGVDVVRYEAEWDRYGKAAGPKRNAKMARYGDALVAVWDGQSPGTRDMLRKAHEWGLPIYLARTDEADDWTNAPEATAA